MSWRRPGIDYATGAAIQPAQVSNAVIDQFAMEVLRAVGCPHPDSMEEFASRFGGQIAQADPSDFEDGSIYVHAPNSFTVLVSCFTSRRRDRFTIAHELGHYFLHSDQGSRPLIAARNGGRERIEWQANRFAGALLMPAELFRNSWTETGGDLIAVAEQFDVSTRAAEIRGKILELTNA